jgi:nitrite reductase (NADH) small subunit
MEATMLDVGTVAEVTKKRKFVVEHEGTAVLVFVHDGNVYAFNNICVHRERELLKGNVFNGKLVCPGHQWAFDLATGHEAVKDEWQPTFEVTIDGDRVLVDVTNPKPPCHP